jgi:hypothetical protein
VGTPPVDWFDAHRHTHTPLVTAAATHLVDEIAWQPAASWAPYYASIVALVDDQEVSRTDLQMAADMDGSARDMVERLMALQVFDTHSDSSYSVEPRLLSAWQASLT